jgi:hypothetical protein
VKARDSLATAVRTWPDELNPDVVCFQEIWQDAIRRTCDLSLSMPSILCEDFNAEPASDEIRGRAASPDNVG